MTGHPNGFIVTSKRGHSPLRGSTSDLGSQKRLPLTTEAARKHTQTLYEFHFSLLSPTPTTAPVLCLPRNCVVMSYARTLGVVCGSSNLKQSSKSNDAETVAAPDSNSGGPSPGPAVLSAQHIRTDWRHVSNATSLLCSGRHI